MLAPGDVAFINRGTVTVSGTDEPANTFPLVRSSARSLVRSSARSLDAVQVTPGSTNSLSPAVIAVTGATFGQDFRIASTGTAAYAGIDTTGPIGFSGTILASAAGVVLRSPVSDRL